MKAILTCLVFFACGLSMFGQQEQQTNDDQLQQQAPREAQVATERAAAREARREEAELKQKEAAHRDAAARQREAELRAAEIKKDEDARSKAISKTK